jgi:hypothetical protein
MEIEKFGVKVLQRRGLLGVVRIVVRTEGVHV